MPTTGAAQPAKPTAPAFTTWRKASASGSGSGGGCVEMADLGDGQIGIRDSKDPTGPVLTLNRHEIACWLDGAKNGEFDDLA